MSKRDDFPKRQMVQVGVCIIMYLSCKAAQRIESVSIEKAGKGLKKKLQKKVQGPNGK